MQANAISNSWIAKIEHYHREFDVTADWHSNQGVSQEIELDIFFLCPHHDLLHIFYEDFVSMVGWRLQIVGNI